ncbi:MurR/RpiR family transcriptional regulator [Vagococcus xieshaowenii]|uniref:MurR/RpiR family transcriptional regulator n=1 Tax=Vagococcus xieshaowenii TaxID=2562451 RepID=A0AAJ5EH26_9ENTE|nr:MurR/RpiR family transcriptional regulator [Vagococcus xieshaowenii]QCA28761.1 MurR/RpiR family transcriptional regulator [Vagococcus xieshaowenii]TFZ43038.1 MurR/RpiR family transcriptional regulator [Vagococcus xieshaowenii]
MLILEALKEQKNFNSSEIELANYILEHAEDVLDDSIQELSGKTFHATSTIYRLCRKIGLKGYKDFKIKLSAELQSAPTSSMVDPNFPFTKDDSTRSVAKKILKLSISSLEYTEQLLTDDLIHKAVELLSQSERIGIFGYGDPYLPALNFQNKMMKIGKRVELTPIPGETHQLAFQFSPQDCAIVLSYSGQSKNMYEITQILKQRHTKIIAITSNTDSHIATLSDLSIQIANKESQSVKQSTFSSQLAIDYVLNTLYSCLFVEDFEKNQQKRISAELNFLNDRFF